MGNKWSEEQAGFIDAVVNGDKNLVNESVAGSGKTSVIVEAAKGVPFNSAFLAFNKGIATELKHRLPPNCEASTFHAFCLKFIKSRVRGVKVDAYKTYNIMAKRCPDLKESRQEVSRLVGLLKNNGYKLLEPGTRDFAMSIAEAYDIRSEKHSTDEIVDAARLVMKHNEKDLAVIDFDDMLYMSLKLIMEYNWQMQRFNTIFLDEAQDTNVVQLALLQHMSDRLIAVGDSHQAIYGFRGAGANSMVLIKEQFGCAETMMSISWRCPTEVIEHAQQWVPHLKARPNAPQGTVDYFDIKSVDNAITNNCLVLCRNNFPLFSVALRLLKNKIPFKMPGKFPERLIIFVKSFKANTINEFRVRLAEWWALKQEELKAANKLGVLSREEDKVLCLMELQQACVSVDEIISSLDRMMRSSYGPVLTTIHGAKGLEADRVLILLPELMPSKYAKTDDELQQEDNLMYVAATRAKQELYYFEDIEESEGRMFVEQAVVETEDDPF